MHILSKPCQNRSAVIGMCSALLLKYRFSKICIVQIVISVALAAADLQKIGVLDAHFIEFFCILYMVALL